jgi:hypothetical protein
MSSSRVGPLIRLLYLTVLAALQILFFAAVLRLNSHAHPFASYPAALSFFGFSFIGSSSFYELNESGITRFLCVVFLFVSNFGIFCGTISQILALIESQNVQGFSRILTRISKTPAPHATPEEDLSGGDDTDSWVKRHFPGWFYKVTLPNREFKKKVASARAKEAAMSDSLTNIHDIQSRLNPHGDVMTSLHDIAIDFDSALSELQGRMALERQSIEARLAEVNELTKRVLQQI